MHIAILGTGSVATALSTALTRTGHTVTHGSRTPDTARGIRSHINAITSAELVIAALPGTAVIPTFEEIGETALGDKIVLDVSNAFTPQFTLAYPNDSVARRLQERFPNLRVVKSLSTMNISVMTHPSNAPGSTVFLSGDDTAGKRVVRGLLADLGWDDERVLDLGGVATAVGPEAYGLLFLGIYNALQSPTFNIAVIRQG
jgi:predicted dinucleotide-binding enzyme